MIGSPLAASTIRASAMARRGGGWPRDGGSGRAAAARQGAEVSVGVGCAGGPGGGSATRCPQQQLWPCAAACGLLRTRCHDRGRGVHPYPLTLTHPMKAFCMLALSEGRTRAGTRPKKGVATPSGPYRPCNGTVGCLGTTDDYFCCDYQKSLVRICPARHARQTSTSGAVHKRWTWTPTTPTHNPEPPVVLRTAPCVSWGQPPTFNLPPPTQQPTATHSCRPLPAPQRAITCVHNRVAVRPVVQMQLGARAREALAGGPGQGAAEGRTAREGTAARRQGAGHAFQGFAARGGPPPERAAAPPPRGARGSGLRAGARACARRLHQGAKTRRRPMLAGRGATCLSCSGAVAQASSRRGRGARHAIGAASKQVRRVGGCRTGTGVEGHRQCRNDARGGVRRLTGGLR